jgi:[acyl-carrier-protein] S-malonyltransferase
MAAILGLDPALIQTICEQVADALTPLPGDPGAKEFSPASAVVSPANLNSPAQTVISGAAAAVARAAALCTEAGAKRTVMLPVSAPFHCALMMPAQTRLATDLAALTFADPAYPVAANVSATLITTGPEARTALIDQVTGAVRWVECLQLLLAPPSPIPPPTHLIELGPGRVLTGLTRQILGKGPVSPGQPTPISLNVEDTASLERAVAALGDS